MNSEGKNKRYPSIYLVEFRNSEFDKTVDKTKKLIQNFKYILLYFI